MSDFKNQFFSWLSRKWFLIILKLVYTLLKLAESSQPFRRMCPSVWCQTLITCVVYFACVIKPDADLYNTISVTLQQATWLFFTDQMHTYLYRSLMQKQPMWAERHEAQEFEKLQLNGKQKVLVQSSHHASSMCGRQDSFSETFISGILLAIIGKGLEMP